MIALVVEEDYNGAERLNDMHEYSFATSLWTQLDVSVGDVD